MKEQTRLKSAEFFIDNDQLYQAILGLLSNEWIKLILVLSKKSLALNIQIYQGQYKLTIKSTSQIQTRDQLSANKFDLLLRKGFYPDDEFLVCFRSQKQLNSADALLEFLAVLFYDVFGVVEDKIIDLICEK